MNRLEALYQVTAELQELLEQEITAKNREQVILQVDLLVEKRGKYMEALEPPYTDEEIQLGQQLIPMNEQIQQLMNELFADLKTEMKQVKKQKKSNRSYVNPYKNVQALDGRFLDSKK